MGWYLNQSRPRHRGCSGEQPQTKTQWGSTDAVRQIQKMSLIIPFWGPTLPASLPDVFFSCLFVCLSRWICSWVTFKSHPMQRSRFLRRIWSVKLTASRCWGLREALDRRQMQSWGKGVHLHSTCLAEALWVTPHLSPGVWNKAVVSKTKWPPQEKNPSCSGNSLSLLPQGAGLGEIVAGSNKIT